MNDVLVRLTNFFWTAAHECLDRLRYSRDSLWLMGAEVQPFANLP